MHGEKEAITTWDWAITLSPLCQCVCVFPVSEGHRAELSSQIITTGRPQLWVWRGRADLTSLELLRRSGKLRLLCNQTSNRRRPGGLTFILALH